MWEARAHLGHPMQHALVGEISELNDESLGGIQHLLVLGGDLAGGGHAPLSKREAAEKV